MGRRTFAEQHYLLKRALTEMSNCSCCSMDGTMIESGGMQELMQQEAAFFGMDQSCMNMLTERVAAKQQEAQALAGERQAAAAATESPPLQPPYVRKRIDLVDLDERAPIRHYCCGNAIEVEQTRLVSTTEKKMRTFAVLEYTVTSAQS